ncbi:MAG: terminase large subunit [Chromatiales bacterium]|nr:terminase large subunit [Gammaproteobacteria bacterium]
MIKILCGVVDDPEYFGIIYSIDDGDDWTDPAVWAKANPNWGVSVNPADIARKARKAMEMSSAQNNFLTKHLNVWVNADTAWMDMIKWDQCGDVKLTIDQFEGQQCWIAFDLASKIDIAAVVILFREGNTYTGFTRSYLAEATVENSSNSQYSGWAADRWLIETPGAITDFAYIEDDIKALAKRFDVQEVVYDPFQATYIATRLMEAGLPMVEYGQTVKNLSEPMKEWEALVIAGDYRHDANPVQTWMVSNVVCHTDAKDNIYPRKEKPENKIDGPVATIMALGAAMSAEETASGPGILII